MKKLLNKFKKKKNNTEAETKSEKLFKIYQKYYEERKKNEDRFDEEVYLLEKSNKLSEFDILLDITEAQNKEIENQIKIAIQSILNEEDLNE